MTMQMLDVTEGSRLKACWQEGMAINLVRHEAWSQIPFSTSCPTEVDLLRWNYNELYN